MYIINLEFRFNVVLITILVLLFTLQYHLKKKDTITKKKYVLNVFSNSLCRLISEVVVEDN